MPWYDIAALFIAVPGAVVSVLLLYDRFGKRKP